MDRTRRESRIAFSTVMCLTLAAAACGDNVQAILPDAAHLADAMQPITATCPPAVGGSHSLPVQRDTAFLKIPLQDIVGSDSPTVAVNLEMNGYVPGWHFEDPFYGANIMAAILPFSYYKIYGADNLGAGVIIDNVNDNQCLACEEPQPCVWWCQRCSPYFLHDWAKKTTTVNLDISSGDPDVGNVRMSVNEFVLEQDGGSYAPNLGIISLPRADQAKVSVVRGVVYLNATERAPADRLRIELSQDQPTGLSSTKVPYFSFASVANDDRGSFRASPVRFGKTTFILSDTITNKAFRFETKLAKRDVKLTLRLDKPCFGWTKTCEELQ